MSDRFFWGGKVRIIDIRTQRTGKKRLLSRFPRISRSFSGKTANNQHTHAKNAVFSVFSIILQQSDKAPINRVR